MTTDLQKRKEKKRILNTGADGRDVQSCPNLLRSTKAFPQIASDLPCFNLLHGGLAQGSRSGSFAVRSGGNILKDVSFLGPLHFYNISTSLRTVGFTLSFILALHRCFAGPSHGRRFKIKFSNAWTSSFKEIKFV